MRWTDLALETAATVLAAAALALSSTVLLPAAAAPYESGHPVFAVVAAVAGLTGASPEAVVAALSGIVGGLFLLYLLDEARRLVGLAVLGAVAQVVVPELRQLGRVVDSVAAAPGVFGTFVLVAALVGGVGSVGVFGGIPEARRDTLSNLKWINFRRAVLTLYILLILGVVVTVLGGLLSPEWGRPLETVGAGLLAVVAVTVLFDYHSERSVAVVGVGGRAAARDVHDGLEAYVRRNHKGFDLSDEDYGPNAGFGYRTGRVLKQTVLVGLTERSLSRRPGRTDGGATSKLSVADGLSTLVKQWLPRWVIRPFSAAPVGQLETADTVVFAVEFPSSDESDQQYRGWRGDTVAPLAAWVRLYSRVPGTDVVVVATRAQEEVGGTRLGEGPRRAEAADRLGVDTKRTLIVDDRVDGDGGYDDLFDRL